MQELKFEITLPATREKLFHMATDYENIQQFFTQQINSIKIIEHNDNITTTEEILKLSSIIKATIIQRTIHIVKEPDVITSKVISGPFRDSILNIDFMKLNSGTKVTVNINLSVPLKYKILTPLIKKYYKNILTGLLYKMNTAALKS